MNGDLLIGYPRRSMKEPGTLSAAVQLPPVKLALIRFAFGTAATLLAPCADASAQTIPVAYTQVAQAAGVPPEVIYSLALIGSGARFTDGCTRPWPWTLTLDGHTERYATRAEAHAAFSRDLRRGTTRLRVGLLQLDWRSHGKELGAPWAALDPYRNLQVGVALLKSRQRKQGWQDALTRYPGVHRRQAIQVLNTLSDPDTDLCRPGYEPDTPVFIAGADHGRIAQLVQIIAPQYQVDPELVLAVIRQESGFNTGAHSRKHAQGLMQLIPSTAARFGVDNPWSPEENIRGGVAYLQWLLRRFNGNVPLTLAGYNAGENAVERYGRIPPFRETRDYVDSVMAVYRKATHPIPDGEGES
jgi:soluble lytic murein transglycosylase-like protein